MSAIFMVSNTSWTACGRQSRAFHVPDFDASTSGRERKRDVPKIDALIEPKTGYRLALGDGNRSFADALRRIQALTQLDWGQIARTIGVSRRTVYNWLSGTRVSGNNYRRLNALQNSLMRELVGQYDRSARDYLLTPDEHGETPLSRISNHISGVYPQERSILRAVDMLQTAEEPDSALPHGEWDDAIMVPELDSNGFPVVK